MLQAQPRSWRRVAATHAIAIGLGFLVLPSPASAQGRIYLTGQDPDFHDPGLYMKKIINWIMDPSFNALNPPAGVLPAIPPFPDESTWTKKFLAVEGCTTGSQTTLAGNLPEDYTFPADYEVHTAATLDAELDELGTTYAGIVVGSGYGGCLTQAELDILVARKTDIQTFINSGGGVFAFSERPGQFTNPYGFLPFVVSGTGVDASADLDISPLGLLIGLTDPEVDNHFYHNVFNDDAGMEVTETNAVTGNFVSLAGEGFVTDSGFTTDSDDDGVEDVDDCAPNDPNAHCQSCTDISDFRDFVDDDVEADQFSPESRKRRMLRILRAAYRNCLREDYRKVWALLKRIYVKTDGEGADWMVAGADRDDVNAIALALLQGYVPANFPLTVGPGLGLIDGTPPNDPFVGLRKGDRKIDRKIGRKR